ncbi:MAG TPA: hypothetical protein VFR03_04505 [Thermoanaerobaculia bacterium]|nr:hypothetical protein [Thermoanaerobaculia bacterium]
MLLIWAFLAAAPALAQPPQVTVDLAPAAPTVGDRVQATLTVRVPTAGLAADPRFPAWGKTWGEVEVESGSKPVKISEQGGTAVWEQRITLAAFKTGTVPLPPVAVAIPYKTGTVQAQTPPELALTVRSVIPPDEKNPLPKPPAPPRSLSLGKHFWWTLAALGAACLGAWALLWLQRRRKDAPGAVPALPPFEELAAALDRLRGEPSMLALHTGVSFAIRRYLGRRLPFPAVESTTSDIQRQLLSRRMPGPLVRQTVELLRACDLVKFARQEVGEAQGRERAEAARRVAGEWESHLAPKETEALEAAG